MTQRENEINNQVVDLTEINRQQAEFIIELEMELAELTDKWKYVSEELEDIKIEKQIRKETNAV
jgi:hypothetical protein